MILIGAINCCSGLGLIKGQEKSWVKILRSQCPERKEVKNRAQKVSMDEQLADLTNQRNDLIKKMNELSDKYENYVQSMNRERVDIQQSNK